MCGNRIALREWGLVGGGGRRKVQEHTKINHMKS